MLLYETRVKLPRQREREREKERKREREREKERERDLINTRAALLSRIRKDQVTALS